MQNLNNVGCDAKQREEVSIFETHTKEDFDYYTERFEDLPNVKVTFRQRTPEEELEAAINQIKAYYLYESDIYR